MPVNAPVCHIPPTTPTTQPGPATLPPIPNATDLPSALKAIAALRTIINTITNQNVVRNTTINNFNTKDGGPPPVWTEKSRTTSVVKVTNPNDPSQYVMVERINQLIMVDKQGNRWTWKR